MTLDAPDIAIDAGPSLARRAAARFSRFSWRRLKSALSRVGFYYHFTSITGRIVALNVMSLLVLLGGMLYLSDFRDRLIGARSNSLKIEAEIIASAVTLEGTPRVSESIDDAIFGPPVEAAYTISLEKSAELLRTLIVPSQTHGYIYHADGTWLVDSDKIYKAGKLTRYQSPSRRSEEVSSLYRLWLSVERMLRGESLPKLGEISIQNGKAFAEVRAALQQGSSTQLVRENELGETILSIAAPIKKGGKVLGALLLTTADGDIDAILADERASVVRVWLFILIVTTAGSFVLAGTIARPMHQLASAAESVRRDSKTRAEIPDYPDRRDEIGHLSRSLRDMTKTLYARLDAIESFAADVAHELKNPLTSLHSAVDTFSVVRKDEDRDRLIQVMRHDVQRLDRLITDISDASRLDSEMARESRQQVNIAALLHDLCGALNDVHRDSRARIDVQIKGIARPIAMGAKSPFAIQAHEGRLQQVVANLLDNAMSFTPKEGKIRIVCGIVRKSNEIELAVEDDGPGIPAENLEKIFDRFYTDRPSQEDFGKNSGLGLNISRQIITAHGGRIWAENRMAPPIRTKAGAYTPPRILGARFVIRLPASG
ncbi:MULTISPECIES: stimulus-sensing domain-containing protein [Rhodomicrobium]|uniref:stimulus-sensing domain-containing protein n=1 Tax=Rhodomicrobium TaxID=1068 RepID=UPI000B4AE018|nr:MULTISPECIES: stimulus-sensing domain-containing protein [Rhodomicrobium]